MQDKQDLKKQRIKTYFLEAAKAIITNEGVENVSVRKVAEIAGYSYATIYNYFADVNELLWDVKALMIGDLAECIQKQMEGTVYNVEGIKKLFKTYIAYYLENPNIFKFFYFHHLSKPVKKTEQTEAELNYDEMWKETFKGFVKDGVLEQKDIEVISKIFIYTLHGMLTLSFSYKDDLTDEIVYRDLENMIDYLL